MNKADVRQHFRDIRANITPSARLAAAKAAIALLSQHPIFTASQHIACYLSCRDEIETESLLSTIWQMGKISYLPVLTTDQSLCFVRYDAGDELQRNAFSIGEPKDTTRQLAIDKLDLIMLPLVAFDLLGHRLGMGGGYYDRALAVIPTLKARPVIMGLAYAAQQADALPVDPWDVMLDGVVTEKGVMLFR